MNSRWSGQLTVNSYWKRALSNYGLLFFLVHYSLFTIFYGGVFLIVGTCILKLNIYESNSLKDKRHVIKSILGRLQSRFNISIAEVDLNDSWQSSMIGFACVTNDSSHANEVISNVIKFIDNDNRVEIINSIIEIL